MSSVTRPRGPLPPRVYWTRRLVVLGTAFLLVFGLAHLLGGGSDGKSGNGDTARQVSSDESSSSSTKVSPGDKASGTPGKSGSKSPGKHSTKKPGKASKTPSSTPLAQPDGPCADDEVVVKPVLTSPVAGDQVTIGLEISSDGSPACTFQVSPSTLVVKLVSGKDFIWSSQECPKSIQHSEVVARSSVPAKVNVYWSGRRSDPDCSRTTDWAKAGWYHAIAAALGGEPTDVQFQLELPTADTITKTATPNQHSTKKN